MIMILINESESSLKAKKKQHRETWNLIVNVVCHAEEAKKILQQEQATHVETLKPHKSEVIAMKERFVESLQQTVHDVYGVLNRAVSQTKEFYPGISIPIEGLNPSKAPLEVTFRGNQRALSPTKKAWLFLFLFSFLILFLENFPGIVLFSLTIIFI